MSLVPTKPEGTGSLTPADVEVSEQEFNRMAEGLGLSLIDARRMEALRVVGKFTRQKGMSVHIGTMVLSLDDINRTLQSLQTLLEGDQQKCVEGKMTPFDFIAACRAKAELHKTLTASIQLLIEYQQMEEAVLKSVSRKNRSFLPNQQVTAIQLNVNTGEKSNESPNPSPQS